MDKPGFCECGDEQDAVTRAPRLPEIVAEKIGASIRAGEFDPGARLPTEKELSERFEVSRMVIREAMSHLRSESLIETRQGLGAFVAAEPGKGHFRIETDGLTLAKLRQIFQLRISVEALAALLAASEGAAKNHERMRAALGRLKSDIADGKDASEADHRFHAEIARASGNTYLTRFLSFLGANLRGTIAQARLNTASRHPERIGLVESEHEAIFEAVVARDGPGAERAMRHHLASAMERLGLGPTTGLSGGAE